ncbi:MAG: tRNA (guanosine(46)-N7)-methyltransferase TrmB [Pseudomonadales bacterium]|nr:tRNA (guanosine(46)-N7)-methyltransferase TrmB [Pseudomonadales bacterium]
MCQGKTPAQGASTAGRIRSFVLRQGRLTPGQARALADLWPTHGLETTGEALCWQAVFGRQSPTVLEIGSGMGASLVTQASQSPQQNFVGVEVYPAGVGSTLRQAAALGLRNLRMVQGDAVTFLEQRVPRDSLDGINVFCPDPWPKKRHHKRRLMQPPVIALLASRLRPGGLLHVATDWRPYADQMLADLGAEPLLRNRAANGGFSPRPKHRPLTKYERRGARLGHQVLDLCFLRR